MVTARASDRVTAAVRYRVRTAQLQPAELLPRVNRGGILSLPALREAPPAAPVGASCPWMVPLARAARRRGTPNPMDTCPAGIGETPWGCRLLMLAGLCPL